MWEMNKYLPYPSFERRGHEGMTTSQQIQQALKSALGKLGYAAEPVVTLQEIPEFGDYSSNAPLVLAKKLGKNPMEVGKEIVERLKQDTPPQPSPSKGEDNINEIVERIEVAKPGFLNFYLNQEFIIRELKRFYESGYSYENVGGGRTVQLEFVSANPTGPLTLANGRAGFYGDVLSRVMMLSGFTVEQEYYVNDAGNQIETLGKSILAKLGKYTPQEDEQLYQGSYVEELAQEYSSSVGDVSEEDREGFGFRVASEQLLPSIKQSLLNMGITFDRFTSEKIDVREKGYPNRFLDIAKEKGYVFDQDGAVWLKTTALGDDKDRVLITSDQQLTYLAADAGHYLETVERGFVMKINVLGADHHGYIGRIQAVAKMVGLEQSEIVIMQLVKLVKDGKEFRMSKRKGTYVTIDEVVEELGADVTRYFFLSRAPNSQLTIDLDLAKKESKENPVFYIQYAGARISSIVSKIDVGVAQSVEFDREACEAKLILEWPEHVARALQDRHVHLLVEYAYRLADSFHSFYERHRVIEDGGIHEKRLSVVLAYRKAFHEVFRVLGVKFLEKM